MAKFNIFFMTTLFLAMVIIMVSNTPVFAQEHIGSDIIDHGVVPASDDYYYANAPVEYDLSPPESESEEAKYLRECLHWMTLVCSKSVYFYMFDEGIIDVPKSCCGELVKMGEPCHIALVKNVFTRPEFSANATVGILRSKQLWKKCALIVKEAQTSAPVPSVN